MLKGLGTSIKCVYEENYVNEDVSAFIITRSASESRWWVVFNQMFLPLSGFLGGKPDSVKKRLPKL